jgi:hypothetical protein
VLPRAHPPSWPPDRERAAETALRRRGYRRLDLDRVPQHYRHLTRATFCSLAADDGLARASAAADATVAEREVRSLGSWPPVTCTSV